MNVPLNAATQMWETFNDYSEINPLTFILFY